MIKTNHLSKNTDMKATIVKNNEFETIGFEVMQGQSLLYSWGIAPQPTNFTKEVSVKDWSREIFQLIKLNGILESQRQFKSAFFKIAEMNGLLEQGQAVNMQVINERIGETEQRVINIIKNII